MTDLFNVQKFIEAREAHSKEVGILEATIKEAINNAVNGMEIETVCLGENKDESFSFTIWGKLVFK